MIDTKPDTAKLRASMPKKLKADADGAQHLEGRDVASQQRYKPQSGADPQRLGRVGAIHMAVIQCSLHVRECLDACMCLQHAHPCGGISEQPARTLRVHARSCVPGLVGSSSKMLTASVRQNIP